MSNRTRQNNKTVDRQMESNDSPEIPDRGRHHNSPASLRGCFLTFPLISTKILVSCKHAHNDNTNKY